MFSTKKVRAIFAVILAMFLASAPLISASAATSFDVRGAGGVSEEDFLAQPQFVQSSVVYGIDDNNVIWEVDPLNKTSIPVNDTELPGISNSMAYDTERDQFFFVYRTESFSIDNSLRAWNRSTTGINSAPIIANRSQLGLPAQSPQPANAAYYEDAYWFIPQASTELHRISFTYVGNNPTNPVLATFDLSDYAAPQYPGGGFGDIAITDTGMLYGSQTNGGRFFSLDLNLLDDTSNIIYTEITPAVGSNPGYQLSFDAEYETLFAHDFDTGEWFEKDITTGALTPLDFETIIPGTGTGFRDLGGASSTRAPTDCAISDPESTNNQTALVNTAVPNPLAVLITDSNGEPVEAVDVVFTVTEGGGNLAGQQEIAVPTSVGGLATSPLWTLGADPGPNTVTASVGNLCALPFNATATPLPAPAIGLTKEVTSLSIPQRPGDVITWLLSATNTGNVPLVNTTIVDPLTQTEHECGTLNVEETCLITVSYPVTQTDLNRGEVFNEATASGFHEGAPVIAVADALQPTLRSPNINLRKEANYNVPPKAGDVVSYTLTSTNIGNVTLSNVVIVEQLEGVTELVCEPQTPVTLNPEETLTCTTTYTIKQSDIDNNEVVNMAVVNAETPEGEEINVEVELTVPLIATPSISLTKALNEHVDTNNNNVIDAGDELIWEVVATNTSRTTLFNVVIDDPLTGDTKDCGALAPEQTCSLQTTPYIITPQDVTNGTVLNEAAVTGAAQNGDEVSSQASNIQAVFNTPAPPAPTPPVTPEPANVLPQTGATVETLIWGALALIIAGSMTFLLSRRPQMA